MAAPNQGIAVERLLGGSRISLLSVVRVTISGNFDSLHCAVLQRSIDRQLLDAMEHSLGKTRRASAADD